MIDRAGCSAVVAWCPAGWCVCWCPRRSVSVRLPPPVRSIKGPARHGLPSNLLLRSTPPARPSSSACCLFGLAFAYFEELAASAADNSSELEEEEPPRPRPLTASGGDDDGQRAQPAGGESEEQRNKFLVLRLYEALDGRDHAGVQALLAADLEWWFHGPPEQQHMMRVLTGGGGGGGGFRFAPRSVDALGPTTVVAEGGGGACYWVHAWTVGSDDGVITQLREYFNTDLTVTRLELAAAAANKCRCVWQSRRPDRATNSLPGLVLAL